VWTMFAMFANGCLWKNCLFFEQKSINRNFKKKKSFNQVGD
jgi:hypothetical protein